MAEAVGSALKSCSDDLDYLPLSKAMPDLDTLPSLSGSGSESDSESGSNSNSVAFEDISDTESHNSGLSDINDDYPIIIDQASDEEDGCSTGFSPRSFTCPSSPDSSSSSSSSLSANEDEDTMYVDMVLKRNLPEAVWETKF